MSNIVQFTTAAEQLEVVSREDDRQEACLAYIADELALYRVFPFMRRDLAVWRQNFAVSFDLIEAALRDTLKAPRPSWTYLARIVERCIAEGCLTGAQFEQRSRLHQQRKRIPLEF